MWLFQNHQTLLFGAITLSLVILLTVGMRLLSHHRLACAGWIMIFGGAVGNWIDRLRYGAVIDFLDFRIWPIFNVADSAITVGVFLFLILFFRQSREEQNREK